MIKANRETRAISRASSERERDQMMEIRMIGAEENPSSCLPPMDDERGQNGLLIAAIVVRMINDDKDDGKDDKDDGDRLHRGYWTQLLLPVIGWQLMAHLSHPHRPASSSSSSYL